MSQSASNAGLAQPPLGSLIKPEQVAKLPNFPEEQKGVYYQGVTKLWEQINTQPKDSPQYVAAYRKLVEASYKIKRIMDTRKEAVQQQAAAAAAAGGTTTAATTTGNTNQTTKAPTNQNGVRVPDVASQPEQRPQSQGGTGTVQAQVQGAAQQAPQQLQETMSQKVLEQAEKLQVIAPPQVTTQQGPAAAQNWIKGVKHKYAQMLQRYETMDQQLKRLNAVVQQRSTSGKPFNAAEMEQVRAQIAKFQGARDQAMEWIKNFQQSQETLKAVLEKAQQGSEEGQAGKVVPKQEQSSAPKPINHTADNQVSANAGAVSQQDALKKEPTATSRPPAMSPPSQIQPTQPTQQPPQPMNPPINTHAQIPPTQHQPQPPNIKMEAQPVETKFQPPHLPAVHPNHPGEPQPLRQPDALEKARSYSQTGYLQNTPSSATHGHPPQQHQQREGAANSHSKMPVPKELSIPAPQPVSMGQSRPTLTNGPMTAGATGQPALQRHPGYVLEGEGERVLSKKKLEELVKQVTGGSGAEGEEGESFSAEVEEVSQSPLKPTT